jgi:hypothetical protein
MATGFGLSEDVSVTTWLRANSDLLLPSEADFQALRHRDTRQRCTQQNQRSACHVELADHPRGARPDLAVPAEPAGFQAGDLGFRIGCSLTRNDQILVGSQLQIEALLRGAQGLFGHEECVARGIE